MDIPAASYNISFSIGAFFVLATILTIILITYTRTNVVNNRFKYFVISGLAMIVLDIATVYTNDHGAELPRWLNMTLNGLYFFSGAVVALLFFYYCVSVALKDTAPKFRQKFYIANVAVLGVFALLLVLNGFFGFFFDFPGGVYTPGGAYLTVNLLSLGYIAESVVLFLVNRKRFAGRQFVAVTIFVAAFFLSFVLQLFLFKKVLLSDFGVAIGSLIVFFTIETPDYVKLLATLNELNELKGSLEIQVANRTEELNEEKRSYEELTLETLSSLAAMIDAKDHYTNGHSFRVAAYSKAIAKELGLMANEQEQIYLAGLIHDVGKVGINESILTKPGKLTPEEYAVIQTHSTLGGDILKGIKAFPVFEAVARSHHERFDGKGYPDKLAGEYIPFVARIVAVADTYDAMTSDRSYRKALSEKAALKEIADNAGTQFDPKIAKAFLNLASRYPDSVRNHHEEFAKAKAEDPRGND